MSFRNNSTAWKYKPKFYQPLSFFFKFNSEDHILFYTKKLIYAFD